MSGLAFRAPNWLGDAVMSTVVLPAGKRAAPDTRLAVLTRAGLGDLFSRSPFADEVVEIGDRGEVDAYRAAGYDRVLLGPTSFGSAWRAFRGRVARRYGFAGGGRAPLLARRLPAREYRRDRHQVENYRALAGLAGRVETRDEPRLVPRAEWREAAEDLWPPRGGARVALQPGATYGPAKRWAPGGFLPRKN